jgi:hypothetical protein
MAEQGWIIGLDPTRGATAGADRALPLAGRPGSLSGAVVGLVSNQKARATEFLQRVYEVIGRDHDLAGPLLVTKETVSSPPTDEDWGRLRAGASVAIAGYGG